MSDYSQLKATLAKVEAEVWRARKLFPDPDGLSIALLEEIGELAQALLDRSLPRDDHDQRISEEAIQVAAVAVRISEEFDPLVDEVLSKNRPRSPNVVYVSTDHGSAMQFTDPRDIAEFQAAIENARNRDRPPGA